MAQAGLSFANPFMGKVNVGEMPNPYAPNSPTSSIGIGGLAPSAADMAITGEQLVKQSQFTMPELKQPPAIAFSPTKRELFVNGLTFAADDASTALQSEKYLRAPGTGLPQGGDWVPLDQQAYTQYLDSIRNPSLSRLASKNFGRGVDSMQMLAGRGLQLAGAEDVGGKIVSQQMEDLRRTSPFERQFTDIESGRGAVEWLVANFAQQGPNLIESVATAGLGFLAGTAAGGPAAGASAAFAGLLGKSAWKESVKAALKKEIAGEALNVAEKKLIKEAAGIAGAVTASYAQNLTTGAADIYGELRDQGADAADTDARLKALAGSVPYAALETLPEFLLAGRVLGGMGAARALPAGAPLRARAGELLRRGTIGGVVGGTAEGTTEAGQEALLLGLSDQDLSSPESVKRLINSFAAGFGVGGPIGAVANLKGKAPANLLDPGQTTEPPTGTAVVPTKPNLPGAPSELPPTGTVERMPTTGIPPALGGAPATPLLPSPTPTLAGQSIIVSGTEPLPSGPGTQGVLNIFGNEGVSATELAQRMAPPAAPAAQPVATPAAPVPQPGQMPLQFAPAAPMAPVPFNPQMPNQMQVIQDRMRRQREFELAQQQVAAQQQAQMDQLAQQSQNARDLFLMQQTQQMQQPQQPQQTPTNLPMVPVQPTMPVQLPLFTAKQAPKPSRAEGLRKGGRAAALPQITGTPVAPRTDLRKSTQVPLFTQEGQPSLAALKAAGVKSKVVPKLAKGGTQAPPTGRAVTPTTVAKARATVEAKQAKTKASVAKLKEKTTKPKVETKVEPVKPSAKFDATVRQGQLARAGGMWREYADKATQPRWSELSDAQKEAWRKTAIEDKRPSIAAAEEIAPPKKAEAAAAAAPVETLSAEEAWEDMKPEGAVEFAALPNDVRVRWRGLVNENKATMAAAESMVADAIDMGEVAGVSLDTPAGRLSDAIATVESTTDTGEFKSAAQVIVEFAYFTSEETNTKKSVDQARAFLANTQFSESQLGILDSVFLDQANQFLKLEARYTRAGAKKDQEKPWFSYAKARNLLPSIKAKLVNAPPEYKTSTSAVSGKIATTKKTEPTTARITSTPQGILGDLINDLISQIRKVTSNNQEVMIKGVTYNNLVQAAKDLYAKVDEAGRDFVVRGYKLREYFNEDGSPKIIKSAKRFILSPKGLTVEQQRQLELDQREAEKALAAEDRARAQREFEEKQNAAIRRETNGVEMDWDSDTGEFYRDDGSPITSTVPLGRAKILVNAFLSKLRIKPNVYTFKNYEDMRNRAPELYKRAAASRKNGDFGTVNAAGFSFGPNVLLFTDFIRTEQQLRFILAHETLGHFGFRGVMPDAALNKVLNQIYEVDPDVRAAVDAKVAQGMPKLEAIEEHLADNAADLDVSIIARIWNAVKNFLNKLGFEFQDDDARYFINLSRKYVRRGDTGAYANVQSIVADMEQLDADRDDGRYARYGVGDLASRAFTTGALNRRFGGTGGLTGVIESFAKGAFGSRRDVPGKVASILEQLQTLDNKARRSYGLNQIYRLLEKQQQYARALLSKYQRMTQFTHSPDVFGFGKGVTEEQKEVAGELLARAALLRSAEATDELIKSYPSLITKDEAGNITVDPRVRQEIEQKGLVTAEEFRKGFDVTYSNGEKVRFQFDVNEDSSEWKIYLELRETVNDAAIDLMLSNYEAAQAEGKRVLNDLNNSRSAKNVFTADDLMAIRKAAELYQAKRYEGSGVANAGVEVRKQSAKESEDFLIAFGRALFNDDVYAAWTNAPNAKENIVADMAEYLKPEYDDLRAALPNLRAKIKSDAQSFEVQKAVRDLFLFDLQSKNSDYYAKRTILGSYVPFVRRGTEQVRLVAVDDRGNPVKLDENVRATIPYFQFDSRSEALDVAKELEAQFEGEWTLTDENGNDVKVKLVPEVSKTRQSPDLTEAVNFNEFIYVLNRLNANITPDVREKIVTTLTNQNSRARRNLQRSGTEGWDKDVVRSVSEHLETSAHVAAKKLYRHRLDDILLNNSNWLGDEQKLKDLKAAVDNATSDGARARAQREYDEYAYMYRYMAGSRGDKTVTIDGKEEPTLGRGEDYREEAKQVLRWYSEASNITDSTEDMLSGEAGSVLKLATVLMQLGGSVATAVINLASLATHSLPYLSYYNSARGFGGGYGESKAATALWQAASDLKNPKLSDAAFLEELRREGYEKFGLTADEAEFIFQQTEEGTLQAAQFNALVGTARGKVFNNKAQAAIKVWMSMFSYTEQLNRRTTALAAYRLEKERALSQGLSEEVAIAAATEAARTAVNTAQGEYAMFNRPEMARGNVLQYIFMYKQFVIVTVQLMRSLPVKGQLLMLGFLLLSSGLKGLPFAEDIFDIVDTIAQKLGLKMASVEKEMSEFLNDVAPGMTPFLMRGVLDRMTGATLSSRMGMGDLIPLTGAFRAGADPAREAADFAGPVFSGISGLVGMAGSLGKYGAEVVGLRDDLTTINGILRDSPIAAMRAMGDSYAFLNSGTVTNAKGQVVSKEAPYHTIIARLLGFYPAIATEQNDIVRLSKYVTEYSKAIKADYVGAYVKARLDGDTERMKDISDSVKEWNEDAKGTGLQIRTFERDANKAAKEAARPTALRYLKSAPRQMRPETIELLQTYGLYDEIR